MRGGHGLPVAQGPSSRDEKAVSVRVEMSWGLLPTKAWQRPQYSLSQANGPYQLVLLYSVLLSGRKNAAAKLCNPFVMDK